jgi:iron complex outermembrane receptor protein
MLSLLVWAGLVAAQGQDTVTITASGAERRAFDTPFAVGVVGAEELRGAGPMVNLSEVLVRVPGLVVNNRSNYAQDLQINSRGFGARASFGVRGLRLYADGIPASGPDGQGQVTNFDLAGAARIEVLRGPFSALYGNSSGGVISLVSEAPRERRISLDADVGSDGLRQGRVGVAAPLGGGFSVRAAVSQMQTDGFRLQSSPSARWAMRLGWEQASDRVVLVLNSINQPALDALGLTRAQFQADPDQTTGVALPQEAPGQADRFNTRKNTWQDQAGLSWRHRFAEGSALRESQVAAFAGKRSVTQWQAIPVATQLNATNPTLTERQPGGVIDFDRSYQGIDGRLVWRWDMGQGHTAQLVTGVSAESSREDRRGFENFVGAPAERVLGVSGKLRRDELNRVSSRDAYAQAEVEFTPQWAATLGVRTGRVEFRSEDHYVVGANLDDSGTVSYRYTNPVLAVQWRASSELNTYVSVGRGFESPTLNELAYRPDGQAGFNIDLKAQKSRQVELGAKWRPAGTGLALDAALFDASSDDEIGVATNRGGRSTFRNVGRTQRRGAELALNARLSSSLRAVLSATTLQATYTDGFTVCAALPCITTTVPVPAGNRIAGTMARSAYAELAWAPLAGVELAAEARGQGRCRSTTSIPTLRWLWPAGPARPLAIETAIGRLELLGRVDNLADRRVAGSVIVNEGNSRFFEPAPGRNWLLSARWSTAF